MTESMVVEAIRASGGAQAAQTAAMPQAASQVADPSSVSRFNEAMEADPVPFVSQVSAAWQDAHANNQGILHRIRALSELGRMHGPSAGEMVELQYEVMNLAFQQEVVTKVADKASTAIQTLIKNQ